MLTLCFHGVGTPQRSLEPDEEQYWVGVRQFSQLLSAVGEHPAIRLTFDDGNASDVTCALPALLRCDLRASFFVVAGRLDQAGSLSSEQVRELAEAGMTVGSHGMTHRPWRSLTDDQLRVELADAAEMIASVSGRPVREIACPFGSYDRRVLGAIRRHGFTRVYSVDGGRSPGTAWLQSRHTIRSHDTPADIARLADASKGTRVSHAVRSGKSVLKRLR